MFRPDVFAAVEVGDGPCNLQHSRSCPCGKIELLKRFFQKLFASVVQSAKFLYLPVGHLAVGENARTLEAAAAKISDGVGAAFYVGGRLQRGFVPKFAVADAVDFDLQIYSVQKRTADFAR